MAECICLPVPRVATIDGKDGWVQIKPDCPVHGSERKMDFDVEEYRAGLEQHHLLLTAAAENPSRSREDRDRCQWKAYGLRIALDRLPRKDKT